MRRVAAFGMAVTVFFLASATAEPARAYNLLAREVRTVKVQEKVPFGTVYIDDPTYYKGYSELVSEGVMGAREVRAQVLYEGGRATRVLSIKNADTGRPVDQVVRRGSKVLKSRTVNGRISKKSFVRPLKSGWLSADIHDYPGHTGVDLAAPRGTPVFAAAGGTVKLSGWYGEYGYCVIIGHADGSETLYAHNSTLAVRRGQTVGQGQKIAEVGSTGNSTGNHLHFEIRVGDQYLDPLIYLDQ